MHNDASMNKQNVNINYFEFTKHYENANQYIMKYIYIYLYATDWYKLLLLTSRKQKSISGNLSF